jgi:hypothetical protein
MTVNNAFYSAQSITSSNSRPGTAQVYYRKPKASGSSDYRVAPASEDNVEVLPVHVSCDCTWNRFRYVL